MFSRLILFSTDHCTLCDRALDMLVSMPELAGVTLDVVDVAEDDELSRRYGERLPVLAVGCSESPWPDLCWPFDSNSVVSWLSEAE